MFQFIRKVFWFAIYLHYKNKVDYCRDEYNYYTAIKDEIMASRVHDILVSAFSKAADAKKIWRGD
jgi:hypothetical protein